MTTRSIPVHFDGVSIQLDEPYPLEPNARLLVTILPEKDEEREAWLRLSVQRLAGAYGEDEPDYPSTCILEANPNYDGR